jgi:hypothetical protein
MSIAGSQYATTTHNVITCYLYSVTNMLMYNVLHPLSVYCIVWQTSVLSATVTHGYKRKLIAKTEAFIQH